MGAIQRYDDGIHNKRRDACSAVGTAEGGNIHTLPRGAGANGAALDAWT